VTIDLDTTRAELLALRTQLTEAAAGVQHDDEGGGELNNASGDQHMADHASEVLEHELDDTLEENAEQVVHEIDLALAKLADGTYGTCSVCGAEIPEERLAAIPYATLCIHDRRRQERG
jgi:RNA polymerase-binding transcription factor DksA